MTMKLQRVLPEEIERRSMEMIEEELGGRVFDPVHKPVIKRVIHATADFEYADALFFSPGAVEAGRAALCAGASIVTDTEMARAGINKRVLAGFGGEAYCFMSDEQVALAAKENGTTRAAASIERAATLGCPLVFALGNAPTGLIRLYELMQEGKIAPKLVIGAPVGFVNVVESKELLMRCEIPHIVARGRKGGSGVAAAIVNALLYF